MYNAKVITSPDAKFSENKIYYFRKIIELNAPQKAEINITADTRYKLWVNGTMVSFGPYKSTNNIKYYHNVDISNYIKDGENEIFVQVLQLASDREFIGRTILLNSVTRSGNVGLLLWGEVDGRSVIKTDETWECAESPAKIRIPAFTPCDLGEIVGLSCLDWKPVGNTSVFNTTSFFGVGDWGQIEMWNLKKCDFPAQKYELQPFNKKNKAGHYDFGRIVTAFVRIKAKGRGKITLTYAESYVFNENGSYVKYDRADSDGEIVGNYDTIYVDGECTHEFFWFRTFRFIKIEGDAEIEHIEIAETGYPLEIQNGYDFGNETDNKLWEICVNSLKCCMHETYEDCPYYEQLQYAMDTYLQMIFNMRLSHDHTLIKKGIAEFASSVSGVAIPASRFPSSIPQYILGFGLFFIFMLDALEKNSNERAFIKQYLGTVDLIITYFETHKREDGLLGKDEYWSFVDWTEAWGNKGVPTSNNDDTITVYNLMYIVTLGKAAELCRVFGRNDTAAEYEINAKKMKQLVKQKCYSAEYGLYADTDKKESYSQHSQVWAVLAEMCDNAEAQDILRKSITLDIKCGFAYAYFLFRALEKADVYELSEDMVNTYISLLDKNCTAVPEEPIQPRSDCHAWGAVMINEFTTMVLGVKECNDVVFVNPYIKGRNYAKGTVFTKHGKVDVSWKLTDNIFKLDISTDKSIDIIAQLPDGSEIKANSRLSAECDCL